MKVKKSLLYLLVLCLLTSCSPKVDGKTAHKIARPFGGREDTYYELKDGSYEYMGKKYKYYLEVKSDKKGSEKQDPIIVLSNKKEVSYSESLEPILSSDSEIDNKLDFVIIQIGK